MKQEHTSINIQIIHLITNVTLYQRRNAIVIANNHSIKSQLFHLFSAPAYSFSINNEKKRLDSEETAMFNDDSRSDESNESELSGSFGDSDSLSYVCQAANGELMSMSKTSSRASHQPGYRTHVSAYILRANEFEQHATVQSTSSALKNGRMNNSTTVDSSENLSTSQTNVRDNISEINPDKVCSDDGMRNTTDCGNKITKLENPTYNISSRSDSDFDIMKPTLSYVKENALRENTLEIKLLTSIRPSKFETKPRVTTSFDGSSHDETLHQIPSTRKSYKRRRSPLHLPACLSLKQMPRSNKINSGKFSTAQSPVLLPPPALHGQSRARIDYADDNSLPSYIIYQRLRADSNRSGDSGLPHDWSLSDDSMSPPRSPNDYLTSQSKQFLKFFSQKPSHKVRHPSDSNVRIRFSKDHQRESEEVKYSYELHPIISETDESVFDEERRSLDSKSDHSNVIDFSAHEMSTDYIKITDLCMNQKL